MSIDALDATPLSDFRVLVTLSGGRRGIFDVKPLLSWNAYRALRDPLYFRRVRVAHGVVCWPQDEDIAPETLEADLQAIAER